MIVFTPVVDVRVTTESVWVSVSTTKSTVEVPAVVMSVSYRFSSQYWSIKRFGRI